MICARAEETPGPGKGDSCTAGLCMTVWPAPVSLGESGGGKRL